MTLVVEQGNITITRKTQGRIPNLPFVEMKDALLGKDYELSLVFPDLKTSTKLHQEWKKKEDPVNILSFPYDETSGEIFITLSKARKEAKNYGRSYYEHLCFLFIHGCLHLKGMTHGAKMEQQERSFYAQFAPRLLP